MEMKSVSLLPFLIVWRTASTSCFSRISSFRAACLAPEDRAAVPELAEGLLFGRLWLTVDRIMELPYKTPEELQKLNVLLRSGIDPPGGGSCLDTILPAGEYIVDSIPPADLDRIDLAHIKMFGGLLDVGNRQVALICLRNFYGKY